MAFGHQTVMRKGEVAHVCDIDHFRQHAVLARQRQQGGHFRLLRWGSGQDHRQWPRTGFGQQSARECGVGDVDAQADARIGRFAQLQEVGRAAIVIAAELEIQQTRAACSCCGDGDAGVGRVCGRDTEYIEAVVKHCRSPH